MADKHNAPSSSSSSYARSTFLISSLLLIRILVGFHKHSGQGDDHDQQAAYGGDYEAQRHWMELTLHLPLQQWYTYDLNYWGLDYPPLTAYVSWLCGYASAVLVGEETVALGTSRGYEEAVHKAFMRGTVLFWDAGAYITAVCWMAPTLLGGVGKEGDTKRVWTMVLALAEPAIILIDHGHFQYNTVAMGLALWSFYFFTKSNTHLHMFPNAIFGSIFFCAALNFKQMTLYYAPAVFSYLLGCCFRPTSGKNKPSWYQVFQHIAILAVTVVTTFALLWVPFLIQPLQDANGTNFPSRMASLKHILKRIFPFERGLFESKVANLWCALSIKPIRIRDLIHQEHQPLVALGVTLVLILPACIMLFCLGQESIPGDTISSSAQQSRAQRHGKMLLLGCFHVSLAFFLASFHVHEKTILIPLSPLSLLVMVGLLNENDNAEDVCMTPSVRWFSIVAAWTLWPLLCVDQLEIPYLLVMVIFGTLHWMAGFSSPTTSTSRAAPTSTAKTWLASPYLQLLHRLVMGCSYILMIALHVAELIVDKCWDALPSHMPDLFPVLWSVAGCGMLCYAYLWGLLCLLAGMMSSRTRVGVEVVAKKKKKKKKA